MESRKKLGALAFLPLIAFLSLYIGCGIAFTMAGAENPFSFFPRHVALLFGLAVGCMLVPGLKVEKKINIFCESMGNSGVMMVILLYLMAGGFQGAAAAIGGKASVVNLALHFIPVSLLIPGVFLVCCLISTALGTSMGTIVAIAPVAISVAQGAGLNPASCAAAVIGGSYFGDNLSMISDTTISAAQGCGSEMKDKFRMNFFIALPAAIVAMVLYAVSGGNGSGAMEAGSYHVLLVLPYIVVLVTALIGMNVIVVLFIGILLTGALGMALGTVDFFGWVQGIGSGMSDMFSISIIAALISGIIGLIRLYGGVDWMVNIVTSKVRNRRGAEYSISLLSGILSAALVNNTIAIITTCPIAKEIGAKYGIVPKRLASLVDIFACAFIALMPHDGGILLCAELAGCNPLDILPYSFYMFALMIFTCCTIQFGLLHTPEEKAFSAKHSERK